MPLLLPGFTGSIPALFRKIPHISNVRSGSEMLLLGEGEHDFDNRTGDEPFPLTCDVVALRGETADAIESLPRQAADP